MLIIRKQIVLIFAAALQIGCSPAVYNISGVDENVINGIDMQVDSLGCVPEFEFVWGSSLPQGAIHSYLLSGKVAENVNVDYRHVMESSVRVLRSLKRQGCKNGKVVVHVNKFLYHHHSAPDVGMEYVTAGIEMFADVDCGGQRLPSDKWFVWSEKLKVGFFVGEKQIEMSLKKATTLSAIGILKAIAQACHHN